MKSESTITPTCSWPRKTSMRCAVSRQRESSVRRGSTRDNGLDHKRATSAYATLPIAHRQGDVMVVRYADDLVVGFNLRTGEYACVPAVSFGMPPT